MSIPFNDTTGLTGIIQGIERELEFEYGYISGNTTRLKEWTSQVNLTHDDTLAMIFNRAGGSLWQFDDSNHTKYPIIKTDLISGQRDYTFTTDEQGNIILDIYRVAVADKAGKFIDVFNTDQQTPNNGNSDTTSFIDGDNTAGVPTRADKTANGIFLDPVPDYNWRVGTEGQSGILVHINREGSYFATTDTTKKPGIAGLYHEYYIVNPCFKHAQRKNLKSLNGLMQRKLELEDGISKHYAFRDRGVKKSMTPLVENSK